VEAVESAAGGGRNREREGAECSRSHCLAKSGTWGFRDAKLDDPDKKIDIEMAFSSLQTRKTERFDAVSARVVLIRNFTSRTGSLPPFSSSPAADLPGGRLHSAIAVREEDE
jgi:hypothetical protein